MLLEQAVFTSRVMGAEKEMDFTIDTSSSIIFDILRDKIYNDKVGSLCREIASNSRDANQEAGRSDVPIVISLIEPHELEMISDPSIMFEDNGLGITPDRMESIFLKYASSTKRCDNSQIGGFGLGAKTPFAYSDTFTIITACDFDGKRMKYTYQAMIDSSKKGKMILFDECEVDSDTQTGTKIIVPIKSSDKYAIERAVHKYTMLWDVKPIIKGFTYNTPVVSELIKEQDYELIYDETSFFNSPYLIVISGIPYPLDTNQIRSKVDSSFYLALTSSGLSGANYILKLNYNIGEITVSANREGLDYTDSTISAIATKLEKALSDIEEKTEKYYTEAPSYVEACIRVSEYNRRYF